MEVNTQEQQPRENTAKGCFPRQSSMREGLRHPGGGGPVQNIPPRWKRRRIAHFRDTESFRLYLCLSLRKQLITLVTLETSGQHTLLPLATYFSAASLGGNSSAFVKAQERDLFICLDVFSGLCFFPSDNGGGWNVWIEIMWTDWSALNESRDSFCEKPIWNVFIILQENFSHKILLRIQWLITLWTPINFGFQNRYSRYEIMCMNFSDLFPTLECICKCTILNSMFHLI